MSPSTRRIFGQEPDPSNGLYADDTRGLRAPRERPLVIADVLEPGTHKLAGGQGGVYSNAWNVRQLRRFYP
jgi:hypothetical protein